MADGRRRGDWDYVWPTTLLQPARPPKLIYLDLNHWIALAKAHAGHQAGDVHRASLEWCLEAVRSGRAVFPISDAIYLEISGIGPFRQRHDLRVVIEELSGFTVIASRPTIAGHEVEALLDAEVGPNPTPINTHHYLDWGVLRALGRNGRLQILDEHGNDVTGATREAFPKGPEAFDAFVADAQLRLQRQVLDGPTPDEEPELRAAGWRPETAHETADRRAEQERELARLLDDDTRWRRARLRDIVSARELLIELNDKLALGLAERGASLEDFYGSAQAPEVDRARRLMDSMPSFDVAVSLKVEYHRDPNHRWTKNDIHDIDALGSSIPFCDVVVTDKAVAHTATTAGLGERFGTAVLSRLDLLAEHA